MTNSKTTYLKVPFVNFLLISQSNSKLFKDKINENSSAHSFPPKNKLPKTPLFNWKPLKDQTRIIASALDYRSEISANQYTLAYRNKWLGKVAISNGRSFWRLETMRQIRRANPNIFKGTVIEVGAGTGIVSSTISKFPEIKEMYCLDYDEYTVENLMPLVQYSLDADFNKIKRVIGSYNKMSFPDQEVNTVVAVGAMHHSEDLDATLRECYRILKPGGYFIISDYALTNSLSQDEYSMLANKPISESEAEKYQSTNSLENVKTNKSISEHARPLFIYQAAAFNAGFTVSTHVFDATLNNGGYFARIIRYVQSAKKSKTFFQKKINLREHGYDNFGNVHSFDMFTGVNYPFYARDKPSLFSLSLFGDKTGKPVYDNMVLILEKPVVKEKMLPFRYRNGNSFSLPVNQV